MTTRTPIRVLATVTFNPNHLRAHFMPLLNARSIDEVILVADSAGPDLGGLRTVTPPRILARIFGRAVAKLIVCIYLAMTLRPAWVVGFNLMPHGMNALVAARLSRTRSVYHQIGGPREWAGGGWDSDNGVLGRLPRPSRIVERILLAAVRRMDVILTMGTHGKDALLERGISASRVAVVPAAVDAAALTSYVRASPEYDVITVGALLPVKRTADLLRAVALLRASGRPLRVAIVGDGPLREELECTARDLGVEEAVSFLGFRDDVHAICARSRIFALPSAYEGLSIAMVDAMALGIPVVASDVGEVRDLIVDGVTGYLCDVGDVAGLASRFAAILDDDAEARRIGDAGRHRAIAHADLPVITQLLESILSELPPSGTVGRPASGACATLPGAREA